MDIYSWNFLYRENFVINSYPEREDDIKYISQQVSKHNQNQRSCGCSNPAFPLNFTQFLLDNRLGLAISQDMDDF
jgi:hypothetical protein